MRPLSILALSIPLAFASGLLAGSGMAQAAEEAVSETAVQCEIRTTRTAGGVRLESVVTSSVAAGGTYQFEAETNSGGGSASTAQGGTFSVAAGGETMLSEVNLGLGRDNAGYTGRLTVEWDGGQTSCRVWHPEHG